MRSVKKIPKRNCLLTAVKVIDHVACETLWRVLYFCFRLAPQAFFTFLHAPHASSETNKKTAVGALSDCKSNPLYLGEREINYDTPLTHAYSMALLERGNILEGARELYKYSRRGYVSALLSLSLLANRFLT